MSVVPLFSIECDICERFLREDGSASAVMADAAKFPTRHLALNAAGDAGWFWHQGKLLCTDLCTIPGEVE